MDATCAGMNAAFIHSSLLLHSFISEPYAPTCRRCLYACLQGQFINDKQVLLKAAQQASVSGAEELLNDEDVLKSEVIAQSICTQLLPRWCDQMASFGDALACCG